MRKIIIIFVVVAIIGFGAWFFYGRPYANNSSSQVNNGQTGNQPFATVDYVCDSGKTITAAYYQGKTAPPAAPGQPPVPGGSVKLALSDGRAMTLKQTISADGMRYSNGNPSIQGNETFVFWSKGNGAIVTENNKQTDFTGCIRVVSNPGNLPRIYENGSEGFSIRYPTGYTVNPDYRYQELGPGKDISGVSFTIASSTAAGTNLGEDTYISVEEIPNTENCSADLFLDTGARGRLEAATTTDNGATYSVASSTGAGVGNRYDETVYAVPNTNPCLAVRYYVHYSVIENYPPGAVKEFDQKALLDQFDAIRRTLTIQQ